MLTVLLFGLSGAPAEARLHEPCHEFPPITCPCDDRWSPGSERCHWRCDDVYHRPVYCPPVGPIEMYR